MVSASLGMSHVELSSFISYWEAAVLLRGYKKRCRANPHLLNAEQRRLAILLRLRYSQPASITVSGESSEHLDNYLSG